MWIWLCRADSLFLIQAKIKRSVCTERKTTLQIVDLHERSPEICKNKIKSTGFFCNLIDCTEILKFDRQNVLSKALLCQTLTRLCRFLLIHICCIHMTFTMQAFQPEYFPYIVLFVCVVSVFPVPFRSPCLFFIKIIRVIFACQPFLSSIFSTIISPASFPISFIGSYTTGILCMKRFAKSESTKPPTAISSPSFRFLSST